MSHTAVDRRAIYDRIRTKASNAGLKFEDDPLFLEWVEQWIAGEMETRELRSRYLRLVHEQVQERKRLRQRHQTSTL